MEKQKLIEIIRKAYLSGIMENELAGKMVGVNHNLEDMATHYAEIEVNNCVLDDVSKQSELLKAFIDFYNYRNTGDKTINNDEIEIFIDSL